MMTRGRVVWALSYYTFLDDLGQDFRRGLQHDYSAAVNEVITVDSRRSLRAVLQRCAPVPRALCPLRICRNMQ